MRRGTSLPELLVKRAAELGYTHLAITDRDGLWAVPRFVKSCHKYGIAPIIGSQIADPVNPRRRLIILTENLDAFRRLSQIVSVWHLDRDNGFDPVEIAAEYAHEGFVVIADMPEILRELHDKIPPGRLFGELTWGDRSLTRKQFFKMLRESRRLERPLVATGNVHMASRDEYIIQAILTAVRTGRCLKDRIPVVDPSCHLKPFPEFAKPFQDQNVQDALMNADELALRCAWEWPARKWLIPPPPDLPQGMRPIDQLREKVIPCLKAKYKKWTPEIQSRLDMELRVIDEQGFANFFLIVSDVVEESKRRGYRTLGRGSAGDSIVSYGLDISQVDPIRYDLYFERFLNPERSSPPDIDLDFSWTHRDEMVEYVEKRYGQEKVASVGTIITLGLKSAFREVGKALGYGNQEISKWSLYLPTWWGHRTGEYEPEDLGTHPVSGELPLNEEPLKTILNYTKKIVELPLHQSVHVGGLVLSPEPISRYAPLNRAAKGFVITQYDMRDCEDVGLIKLDLLSQRGLGCYEDAVESIARNGEEIKIDLSDMDAISKDEPTIRLFKKGATVGCFDAESPMIRGLIRKLGAPSYDMHMASTALIRPGVSASGMMQEFIERHHNPAKISNAHPKMAEILKDTYGVIVYQEDVLKVLHELAGVSLGKADLLRRMMSGKALDSRTAKEDLEREFHENCEERGIDLESREKIWKQIASFVGYSFCKAHAAQFAILAWQSAYLKAHHTAEFFAGRLGNCGGYFPVDYYIRDARRFGVNVELPEVNRSEKNYVGRGNRVLMGLIQVGCLHEDAIDSILLARNTGGKFGSVADFLARSGAGYEQTHALIRVGAFRSLHTPRPVLLSELAESFRAKIHRPAAAPRQPMLFSASAKASADKSAMALSEDWNSSAVALAKAGWDRDYTLFEQIQAEIDVLGMIVSIHPLEPLKSAMRKAGFVQGTEMKRCEGRRVRMGGILVSFKPATTKDKGDPMAMISLEDLSGTFDTVIFPDAYARHALILRARSDGGLCMEGKVQADYGTHTLVVDKVMPLNEVLNIQRSKRQQPNEIRMGLRPTIPAYPSDVELESECNVDAGQCPALRSGTESIELVEVSK
jgi:DNA-directed DNA polymerase III PolC